jgi:hypothetical protein
MSPVAAAVAAATEEEIHYDKTALQDSICTQVSQ